MDAQTFAALCRGLFLEPTDFVNKFGVSPEEVFAWAEAGDPPLEVMQWILELTIVAEEMFDESFDALVGDDEDLELEELPAIELSRYASAQEYNAAKPDDVLPWSAHSGVVSRLAVALTAMGYPVDVVVASA